VGKIIVEHSDKSEFLIVSRFVAFVLEVSGNFQ